MVPRENTETGGRDEKLKAGDESFEVVYMGILNGQRSPKLRGYRGKDNDPNVRIAGRSTKDAGEGRKVSISSRDGMMMKQRDGVREKQPTKKQRGQSGQCHGHVDDLDAG